MKSIFWLFVSSLLLCLWVVVYANEGKEEKQALNWLTSSSSDGQVKDLLASQPPLPLQSSTAEETAFFTAQDVLEVDVYPQHRQQSMEGFGAGLPQGSAYVLTQLKQRNNTLYQQVLQKLVGTVEQGGVSMNMMRFPIGSCDFSMSNTTYDEVSGTDFELTSFQIDPDSLHIITVLQDMKQINPSLHIIASPWSAPSWMKVMQSLIALDDKNTLIDDDQIYLTYANYFVKMVDTFATTYQLQIDYITLQNEPLFGNSKEYPGMYVSAKQSLRLAKQLAPLLQGKQVQLLAYDHNWDHPEYPMETMQGESSPFVGTAWHCYGGDMATAQDRLQQHFPQKEQHVTECTGSYPNDTCDITQGMTGFGYNHEWDMSNILLGATGHWAKSGLKWVLALDEHCGPTLPLVGFKNGRPLVAIPSTAMKESDIYWNQDYWSIAHMSKFIARGDFHVETKTVQGESKVLVAESFLNTATSTLTTIVMNTNHDQATNVVIVDREHNVYVKDTLPAFSTKVYQWSL